MNLDEIAGRYADRGADTGIVVREIKYGFVVIEATADGLRFLGELFQALADSEECKWYMSPEGSGSFFMDKNSPKGIYMHRLPCQDGSVPEDPFVESDSDRDRWEKQWGEVGPP